MWRLLTSDGVAFTNPPVRTMNAPTWRKSSIFLGRIVGVVFMRVKSKCAHQVRPLSCRQEGSALDKHLATRTEALARRPLTATRYNGMIHDFVLLNAIHEVPGVQAALQQTSDAIRGALKP